MLQFKSDKPQIKEVLLNSVDIPKGEMWYISIPKSISDCGAKLVTIQCKAPVGDCQFEQVLTNLSCIYKIDNDEKSYLSLVVIDKEDITPFEIVVEENSILEFEGGSFDDLLLLLTGMELGYDINGYGVTIYFDKQYSGKIAATNSLSVYLLNETFCYNNNSHFGISFCFSEIGCYRLGLIKNGEIIAISDQINVISYKPYTPVVEYYDNNIYHRHRIGLTINEPAFVTEEDEKILSSGELLISNSITRRESEFETTPIFTEEHVNLIKILKRGVKVNGEYATLRGAYTVDKDSPSKRRIGSGRLIWQDFISTKSDCNIGCSTQSVLKYEM